MGTYVMGDIHGCFDEFMDFYYHINEKDKDAKFILTGDVIDRGPKTLTMLNWAMACVNKPDGKFQMVLGNHEHMKIELLEKYLNKEASLEELALQDQYGFINQLLQREIKVTDEEIYHILQFFKSLPLYIETDVMLSMKQKKQHYIVVHSNLPMGSVTKAEMVRKRLSESEKYQIIWGRNYIRHYELKKSIVIHGHTPTISRDSLYRGAKSGRIHYLENDINVDCGIVYRSDYWHANLGAIRLEDLEEFYLYEDESELFDQEKKLYLLGIKKRDCSIL